MAAHFLSGLRLIAAIYLLRCQRWAFTLYTVAVGLPVACTLVTLDLAHIPKITLFTLAVDIIPALVIFILVMAKWGEFD